MGVQQRDKIGFGIQCINGDTKAVTAHLTDTLGTVNGYDEKSTKCLIEAFQMNNKLSDYFSSKMKYDSQVISGVMGLKNAADLMYDVSPKVLGVIQPPWMPNMRFSKYVITGELICWGSFGVDPDIFDVANPTFYVHQTQIDSYCTLAEQDPSLIKPIHYPSNYRVPEGAEDKQPD